MKITGFAVLTIFALAMCAAALYLGRAPLTSPYPLDWFDWARTEDTWPLVFAVGILVLLIGLGGMVVRLIAGAAAGMAKPRKAKAAKPSPLDTSLSVPAEPVNTRASLRFDDTSINGLTIPATAAETVATTETMRSAEPPSVEMRTSTFSDNASDSFLTRTPQEETIAGKTDKPFDPEAALSETHGLQVAASPVTAQVIPIRPNVKLESTTSDPAISDPVEAALLAEAPQAAPRDIPASDITSVVSSAMRFIETPPSDATPVEEIPVETTEAPAALSGFHSVAAQMEPTDDQAIVRQAVQMALSVWPDTTRAIAADELAVRVAYLYYDKTPQSTQAFQQIASGELSAAATTLQNHADSLNRDGANPQAAEIWRVIGALHMGRDDPKALMAYEKVSELDPTDANIHVYLARRYQIANETGKLIPVLQRALAVVGDPATRLELLAPYADLKMKAGEVQAAGDAFEELGRLHETRAYLKPDDVSAKSAQGISLARSAQAREMQGAFDQAGSLYKKAHGVFADLSAQLPEHAGLRSMADNALRDAQRFNMA